MNDNTPLDPMEVEILKEAIDLARSKKPTLHLPSWGTARDGSR